MGRSQGLCIKYKPTMYRNIYRYDNYQMEGWELHITLFVCHVRKFLSQKSISVLWLWADQDIGRYKVTEFFSSVLSALFSQLLTMWQSRGRSQDLVELPPIVKAEQVNKGWFIVSSMIVRRHWLYGEKKKKRDTTVFWYINECSIFITKNTINLHK